MPDTQVMARKFVSRVSILEIHSIQGMVLECTIFAQQQAHAPSLLGAKFQPPFFCFDSCSLNLDLPGSKTIIEIQTKTRISTPMPPFWQGNGTKPPTLTLDPKLIYLYAEVLHV